MRLLYVCSDFGIDPSGTKGASIHLRAITRAIAELGHEVALLSPKDGPGPDHPAGHLLKGGCPPAEECGRLLKGWLVEHGLNDGLARELRPLLYNAWVRAPALQALRAHPVDAILERLSLHGQLGVDLATELDLPLIVEVNALLTEEARQFRGLQLPQIAESLEQRVFARADLTLCVSRELAEQLAARGVEPRKIQVVPNGADLALFAAAPEREACRAALGLSAAAFVVGFVGSLKPWHGVDVLLEAFARFAPRAPGSLALIVGAGPEEPALRAAARRLGIESSVVFTGALPHAQMPAYLKAMDVATAPYRPLNGFYFSPIKLYEYMAAGTCVVAARIGQVEEVIRHNDNGVLCQAGDADDLVSALLRLRGDPALRERLAAAALYDAREKHSWERAARQVVALIERARCDYRPARLAAATRCPSAAAVGHVP